MCNIHETETVVLNKVTQTQQYKCSDFPHMRYYYPQTDKDESIQVRINMSKNKETGNWKTFKRVEWGRKWNEVEARILGQNPIEGGQWDGGRTDGEEPTKINIYKNLKWSIILEASFKNIKG